ncbi:MAG: hypothetical protein ACUVTN_00265, partial [Thermodesulfobacteriota bacterium]
LKSMKKKIKWAFIHDKDEFVRLSLSKILKKYGFEVEEIEDLLQLEGRKKDIRRGIILADLELEALERWLPVVKKWNDRFILMTPIITDELKERLKKSGIHRILKKPVEPRLLRKVIQGIPFSEDLKFSISERRGEIPIIQPERR